VISEVKIAVFAIQNCLLRVLDLHSAYTKEKTGSSKWLDFDLKILEISLIFARNSEILVKYILIHC
jgi:hypothetical protein